MSVPSHGIRHPTTTTTTPITPSRIEPRLPSRADKRRRSLSLAARHPLATCVHLRQLAGHLRLQPRLRRICDCCSVLCCALPGHHRIVHVCGVLPSLSSLESECRAIRGQGDDGQTTSIDDIPSSRAAAVPSVPCRASKCSSQRLPWPSRIPARRVARDTAAAPKHAVGCPAAALRVGPSASALFRPAVAAQCLHPAPSGSSGGLRRVTTTWRR